MANYCITKTKINNACKEYKEIIAKEKALKYITRKKWYYRNKIMDRFKKYSKDF